MSSSALIPLFALTLINVNLALFFLSKPVSSNRGKLVLSFVTLLCSVLPVFAWIPAIELPLILYERAIFGDPGIMTLGVMALILAGHVLKAFGKLTYQIQLRKELNLIYFCIPFTAIIFYPTALGWTWFDLYAAGYQPLYLSLFVMGATLCFIWLGYYFLAGLLTLSLGCHFAGVLDSDNLWDYLIDIVLVIYASFGLIHHRIKPSIKDYVKKIRSSD